MLWFCSCCCRLFYQYPTCQNQVVLTSSSRLCCQFLSCFFFVRSFVCSTTYVLLEHTTLCCLFAPAIFRPFVAKAAIFRTLARRRLGDVKRKKIILTFSPKVSQITTPAWLNIAIKGQKGRFGVGDVKGRPASKWHAPLENMILIFSDQSLSEWKRTKAPSAHQLDSRISEKKRKLSFVRVCMLFSCLDDQWTYYREALCWINYIWNRHEIAFELIL